MAGGGPHGVRLRLGSVFISQAVTSRGLGHGPRRETLVLESSPSAFSIEKQCHLHVHWTIVTNKKRIQDVKH